MTSWMIQGVLAFIGSFGFAILCNIKGRNLWLSALGGMIGWSISCGLELWISDGIIRCFLASVSISLYAQTMALVRKSPASVFLVVGLFPLVPGYAAYKTMEGLLLSDMPQFAENALYTFKVVMAIAMGFLVSGKAIRKPKPAFK